MKNPRKHSIEVLGCINAILFVKGDDNLAVRVRLERVWFREAFAEDFVVVDLAVDGKSDGFVLVENRLSTSVNTDNTQTLVDEDSVVGSVVAAPVRSTMSRARNLLA